MSILIGKWGSHVDNLAPPSYGSNHFRSVFFVELLNRVVTGHHEDLVLQRSCSSFAFSVTWISVHPNLEIVAETSRVVVVEKDSFLIRIPVEPFVLGLEVDVLVMLSGISGLAYSWWSPNPHPSDIFGDVGHGSGDSVGVDSLFEGKVSVDTDKSLSHGFFCADFQQFLVLIRF